ncbi:MAG: class I SAM-dependent methyltransferase [Bacteroidota bacterium]
MDENELKNIASQLRQPHGEKGIEIGDMMNDGNLPMNMHSLAVLNPEANDHVLELGMGNGAFIKNIVNMDPSIQYTGYDYSDLMVEEAVKNNRLLVDDGRVKIVKGDGQNLPFENNSFNKIFTINTLYFWEDVSKVFSELKRVLRPKGKLIISIRPKHNLEKFPVTAYGFSKFTKADILRLFQSNGFAQLEVTEIVEPPQERDGNVYERESLIVSGQLN